MDGTLDTLRKQYCLQGFVGAPGGFARVTVKENQGGIRRYSFTASQPVDGLRPLRDPDAVGLDDDDGQDE
ncbi:hypothetical protein [Streptomyces sp. NPDC048445]|uniref:hypothetical protein n=1 Tax=Streptomyces sp. NPDC048445 TaxID=3365553 RepID=UPI00371ACED2